jgi:Flp pilus assembly protein TadD
MKHNSTIFLLVALLMVYGQAKAQEDNSEVSIEQKAYFHYDQGCRYFSRWKLPLAQVELEEAVADKPDLSAAHRRLCLLDILQLNVGGAVAQFMAVVGVGEPIPYTLDEKLELNQKACKLHYEDGLKEADSFKWAGALAEFQLALNYCPDNARVIRSQAFAYANVGAFDKAESLYKTSFALDPKDAFTHADLAVLLSQRGEITKAQGEMAKAVRLAPDAAALHVDLGWMAQSHGDLATARQEFSKAIELSPNHAALWTHLGDLLMAQGQKQQAIDAYQHALTLDATDQENVRQRIAKLKAKTS